MGSLVFLGAFKVNSIRDTASINVGSQILIGLDSASSSKMGGSQVNGDEDPVFTPTGVNVNNDTDDSTRLFSSEGDGLP